MSATTSTPNNALIVKQKTFKDLIEKAKGSIMDILPKHLSPDRLARTMLLAMTRQPLLYECSVESILQAFLTCAELGLEPGGIRGYMYLIPFWNSKLRGYECQTIPGYRGLMHMARNSMEVSYFAAHVVHANDKFRVVYGLHEDLIHEPCMDDNPGVAMGVYAVAFLKSGERQFEVMTRSQVESIKNRTKSRDKNGNIVGPWVTDEEEMWRKTVLRRIVKYMELSEQMEKAIELDDASYVLKGPEKATVDMAGMLNAPQERGAVIDLGQIRPAEPVPVEQEVIEQADIPNEDLPWFDGPEPEPPPEPPKSSKKKPPTSSNKTEPASIVDRANSIIADLVWQCQDQGVTSEGVVKYIGLPVSKWTEAILQALEVALERLAKGETAREVFPEMYGEEGR